MASATNGMASSCWQKVPPQIRQVRTFRSQRSHSIPLGPHTCSVDMRAIQYPSHEAVSLQSPIGQRWLRCGSYPCPMQLMTHAAALASARKGNWRRLGARSRTPRLQNSSWAALMSELLPGGTASTTTFSGGKQGTGPTRATGWARCSSTAATLQEHV